MNNSVVYLPLLTALILLLIGLITSRWYPGRINPLAGYRSRRSMQSQEAWTFAQTYSAKIAIRIAFFPAAFGFIALFFPRMHWVIELALSMAVLVISFGFLFMLTEKGLKEKFEKHFNP